MQYLVIDLVCFTGMGVIIGFLFVNYLAYTKKKNIQYYVKYFFSIALLFFLIIVVARIADNVDISIVIGLTRIAVFIIGVVFGKKITDILMRNGVGPK